MSKIWVTLSVGFIMWSSVLAEETMDSAQSGAHIFLQRCSLCHGSKGLGEGVLPLMLGDYPNTNLRVSAHANSAQILRAIREGGGDSRQPMYSPPWKNELSDTEVDEVAAFVALLQRDLPVAISMLNRVTPHTSRIDGGNIFQVRCARCHGSTGRGDGKMRSLVNNPPPADLTLSSLSAIDVTAIVGGGGQALDRSKQMPPWGQELSPSELRSVVNYVLTLRNVSAFSPTPAIDPKSSTAQVGD